jgi:hypothetical protein
MSYEQIRCDEPMAGAALLILRERGEQIGSVSLDGPDWQAHAMHEGQPVSVCRCATLESAVAHIEAMAARRGKRRREFSWKRRNGAWGARRLAPMPKPPLKMHGHMRVRADNHAEIATRN